MNGKFAFKKTKQQAVKNDAGKSRMDLIPFDALNQMGLVLAYGALKYSERNWEKGLKPTRVMASLLRHIAQLSMGEELDDESKLPHHAHITANALMLSALLIRGGKLE